MKAIPWWALGKMTLPSAATFHYGLFLAHAVDEQEHTLSQLHGTAPLKPYTTSYTPNRTYHNKDRKFTNPNPS